MAHFIPHTKTFDAMKITTMSFKEVVKLHCVEDHPSNLDVKLKSKFWEILWKIMKTKLQILSYHHPQTDS